MGHIYGSYALRVTAVSLRGAQPRLPLLSRSGAHARNRVAWKWPVKAAVQASDSPPTSTAYALHHGVISDLVHEGLDLLSVAQVSGTSPVMIECHYGHPQSPQRSIRKP